MTTGLIAQPEPWHKGPRRDSSADGITECLRLGEVEGLKVSLAGAEDKLAQIDTTLRRRTSTIQLGTPTFTDLAGRTPSR
jgi:hypothetical protein